MTADWMQFLQRLQRSLEAKRSGYQSDLRISLRKVAGESMFADDIQNLVLVLDSLPEYTFVFTSMELAGLLGRIEWPPDLDRARRNWLEALQNLLRAMDVGGRGTLGNLLRARLGETAPQRWFTILENTHRMIDGPCGLSEISFQAKNCNLALEGYLAAMKEALGQAEKTDELSDARVAFMYAHSRYAENVRAFNQAMGAVLFYDFSPPLS